MKKLIKKNAVGVLASLVFVLIVVSTILVVDNRRIMIRTAQQQELSELTLVKADMILNNLQAIDLGLRAYAITSDKGHLKHYKDATGETLPAFDVLEQLMIQQNHKAAEFQKLKEAMTAYVRFCDQVVQAIEKGDTEAVKEMISQDKGFEAWSIYQQFHKNLSEFEKKLTVQAQVDYDNASSSSIWTMVVLLIISLPTLGLIVYLLHRAEKNRKKLFVELENNNRKYNFNSGEPISIQNEYQLVNGYIENSKKAADFVNQVAIGKYDVQWDGLDDKNISLNQESLAGALVKMRDQMKLVKHEEGRRLWMSRGLAEFSELIRINQESISTLAYHSIVYLVKYLNAQQGGFFVINTDSDNRTSIDLAACYAFNRQKFINCKIEVGEGLIGQAYLEAETIMLTDVPKGYTNITSGLGDSTPACVLIVPMKYNDEVQVIIEIASFSVYDKYQVEFLEKVGEFIGSAVASAKTNEVTKRLLLDAQNMTEEMRSQEEEMRQNMEELSATQEEMHRKELEYIQRIEELESQLHAQL